MKCATCGHLKSEHTNVNGCFHVEVTHAPKWKASGERDFRGMRLSGNWVDSFKRKYCRCKDFVPLQKPKRNPC